MKTDAGPAFPSPDTVHPNGKVQYGTFGMSLRDYIAIHASEEDIRSVYYNCGPHDSIATRQEARYRFANAMLAAREKGQE